MGLSMRVLFLIIYGKKNDQSKKKKNLITKLLQF